MSIVVSFAVIFILTTSIIPGITTLSCDDPIDLTIGVCGQLFKDIERALLRDEGNLFRIRRLFFHSPTASPVLIKVYYNVTYSLENLTIAAAEKVDISFCFSPTLLNSSMTNLEQVNITLGWTSSGIYNIFHPTMLSVMQAQSPFAFLRIIHRILANQRSPEANTFLWDGSYELPSLHLNLHIQSLTCIPSKELLESLLMDLNTLVCHACLNQCIVKFITVLLRSLQRYIINCQCHVYTAAYYSHASQKITLVPNLQLHYNKLVKL